MTINTTLPVGDAMRFRKSFFRCTFIKIILSEQVKILNYKIRANKAQYDLDKQAAKISALSSSELEKYEHLTGGNLGYKLDVVQKTKFEYSPPGQVFNIGLDVNEKRRRTFGKTKEY